jgi:hypothetical protein
VTVEGLVPQAGQQAWLILATGPLNAALREMIAACTVNGVLRTAKQQGLVRGSKG